jgi:hypothetical protein
MAECHRLLLAAAIASLGACGSAGCAAVEKTVWSIGIYEGPGPLALAPAPGAANPVLAAADVTDRAAAYVADPFMVREGGTWYLFFEVASARTGQGDIALATSDDGLRWTYREVVLDEPFHLSYPCVFKCNGRYYMVPETRRTHAVRLYRADRFPDRWSQVATLLNGDYVDPTVLEHGGRWWMFASKGNGDLYLFWADRPEGPWTEHPKSPVVRGDPHRARPGGRAVDLGETVLRFAQDDFPTYGNQVRAFVITRLTTDDYQEHEAEGSPILKASASRWNARGMHQVDPHRTAEDRWIACVDGH